MTSNYSAQKTSVNGLKRKHRRKLMRIITAILALMILLSSCSSSRQAGGQSESKTLVRVENRNFLDMKVYILRGNERIRIGTVTGNGREVFVVPDGLIIGVSSLRFLA